MCDVTSNVVVPMSTQKLHTYNDVLCYVQSTVTIQTSQTETGVMHCYSTSLTLINHSFHVLNFKTMKRKSKHFCFPTQLLSVYLISKNIFLFVSVKFID